MLDNIIDKITEYTDMLTEMDNIISSIPSKLASAFGGLFKK